MLSVGYLLIFALLLFTAIYFPLAKGRGAKTAYIAVAWLPLALLLYIYIYQDSVLRALSYGIILLVFLVMASSLMLGAVGLVLLIRATRHGEPRLTIAIFTAAAFAPSVVYLRLLLA